MSKERIAAEKLSIVLAVTDPRALKREELVVERNRREDNSPILVFHPHNVTGR